jgi:hemolysin activation/secretion protein
VGAVPLSRLEGDPTASVLRGEVFGEYRPVPAITFALGVRAQVSDDPLLSFEEFSAGNYTVGRGYDPGSLLGDNGAGLQFEARFGSILPTSADRPSVQPYLFVDAAKIDNEDRLTADGNDDLVSAGVGLRGIYRGATLDVAFAVPLARAGLQTERPDPRLLISLTTRLFPWSF